MWYRQDFELRVSVVREGSSCCYSAFFLVRLQGSPQIQKALCDILYEMSQQPSSFDNKNGEVRLNPLEEMARS